MAAAASFRQRRDDKRGGSAAAANDFIASPAEQVRRLYKQAEDFREELSAHLVNGHVSCSPECFVMGRAVDLRAPRETVLNP